MVKVKYDSRNVDRSKQGGASTPPAAGVYRMEILACEFQEADDPKNGPGYDRLIFTTKCLEGDDQNRGKGYRFWDYVNLELDWKVDQWLQAIGVDTEEAERGSFDTRAFKGKEIIGRTDTEMYNGTEQGRLKWVGPDVEDEELEDEDEAELDDELEDEEEDEELEDEDEDEDEDDEDEEPPPPPKKKRRTKPAPEPEPEEDEDEEDEDDEDFEEDGYEDMTQAALKKEAKSRGISVTGSKSALVARLREHDDDPFAD